MKLSAAILALDACAGQLVLAAKCPATTKAKVTPDEFNASARDFANLFYTQKKLKGAVEKYVATDYIQHNDGLLDGRQTLLDNFTGLWADPETWFCIKQMHTFDQRILVMAEGSFGGGPTTAIYDLHRVQGNCIVKHWDALMERKAETVSKHPYF